ncbi:MAG: hypothetical protein H0X24_13695 [Ktedonobacterales bacterium]|nr:hypothetical protein [Ktedonobacterales bacterium]
MQPQDQSLSVTQGATSEAHTLVQELQTVLNRFLATGTTQAAQAINEVAVAAEQMGQQLRQDQQAGLADTVDGLAQQIRHFTTTMQQQDIQTTLHDIEEGAKQHRNILIGGGIILGLLAAKVASSRKS